MTAPATIPQPPDMGAIRTALIALDMAREDALPPLPPSGDWHRQPLARQIIADMRRLDAETQRLDRGYDGTTGLETVWRNIGTIEDALDGSGSYARLRRGQRTVLDELADRLEMMRDDAIDAARLLAYPASWYEHAEAYDDYSDRLREHFDSAAVAVQARRDCEVLS